METVGERLDLYVAHAVEQFAKLIPAIRKEPPSVSAELAKKTTHSWAADMLYLGVDVVAKDPNTCSWQLSAAKRCYALGKAIAGHAHLLLNPDYSERRGQAYFDGALWKQTRETFCTTAGLMYVEQQLGTRSALEVVAGILVAKQTESHAGCALFARIRKKPNLLIELGSAKTPFDQTKLIKHVMSEKQTPLEMYLAKRCGFLT